MKNPPKRHAPPPYVTSERVLRLDARGHAAAAKEIAGYYAGIRLTAPTTEFFVGLDGVDTRPMKWSDER